MKLLLVFLFLFSGLMFAQSGKIEIRNEKYGIVDLRNKTPLTEFIYEDIEVLRGLGYLVLLDDKIGLLDKNAKKILDCVYADIFQILDNPNYVVTENIKGEHAVYSIKERKNILNGFVADMYNPVSGPYDERTGMIIKTVVIISKNRKKTLLELPLKYLLPLQYDEIVPCIAKPGNVLLRTGNKYQIYKVKERVFVSSFFEIQKNDKFYLIHDNQCLLTASDFFPVKIGKKWGLMNIYGKFKLTPKYDDMRVSLYPKDRTKAFTAFKLDSKWFLYNNGRMKPIDAHYFLGFWYNYAVVFINEKVLFYDLQGNKLLSVKLIHPEDTPVKAFDINGKYGLIDYKSRLILDFLYQNIIVAGNRLLVQKNGKYALYDNSGQAITTFKYDDLRIGSVKDKIIVFKQYGKYGLMNFEGNMLVKPKYTYISAFKNGIANAKVYKTVYRINTKGEIVE